MRNPYGGRMLFIFWFEATTRASSFVFDPHEKESIILEGVAGQ
jgi:hypothetical protein